ncbi:M48 family metalloprotease [Psychrobacter sp. Rd 27.2]|uniref:M48 family metalloprotease n=1 Tax=Psychrobacter sp. Rd 27.2 TaxID=1926479 RepID=UPI000946C2D1|nr:M48 family metalloprotease [Psychrobacter sp. Rd 27.2]OLF41507.1 peptidase M48 [Psychrobacter sp. Rd 27.2]
MDFFAQQRIRTRRSLLLYGLFFLIVLAHIAVALGVVWLLLTIFTGGIYYWALVLVIVWIIASFVGGSFVEYRRLRAGGRAIAQRVGAVRLFVDSSQDAWEHSQGVAQQHTAAKKVRFSDRQIAVRDERDFPPVYRRYYEIAQQLAIASGLDMPILYVLPDEQGINGFVAGRHSQDMVLVVTQGALDKLSDEALYGLIGHEYGHILHGDATFNLQLMVVLAGLQLLYDWSDSINNFGTGHKSNQQNYFNNAVNQNNPLSQRAIDSQARITEAQTANFNTHSEWVAYWQNQSQSQQSSAKSQSRWLQHNDKFNSQAPRNIWKLLIHGLSFSSMASAQLIKYSFNRERELLADATSVQLTRSPAIIETLKAIHQDTVGSRLTNIADINGLSHFFFASSGADLGDVSWFATHPSLAERMSVINANAYHDFAVQVAKEKHLNQQKIKEIYEQRRLGDWGEVQANSLSKDKKSIFSNLSTIATKKDKNAEENIKENVDVLINEPNNALEAESALPFTTKEDVVIDGRLQVSAEDIGACQLLKPWMVKPNSDLPKKSWIDSDDLHQVCLPQYVLDHSHHSLGAQALIEAIMLCHQRRLLTTTMKYDLHDVWEGVSCDEVSQSNTQQYQGKERAASTVDSNHDGHNNPPILPHTIDAKLLTTVANLDRRLDSAVLVFAIKQLHQQDLSAQTVNAQRLQNERSHDHHAHQHYQEQKSSRTMLARYQCGLLQLFARQLAVDLTFDFAQDISADLVSGTDTPLSVSDQVACTKSQEVSIVSLWQALHLQRLLPTLSAVLNDKNTDKPSGRQALLQAGMEDIGAQLDPSGQVFSGLDAVRRSVLILLAYRLSKNAHRHRLPAWESAAHYIVDVRRHARLIDIDLNAVSDANLQWLLMTASHLNSSQLLAVVCMVPAYHADHADTASTHKAEDNNCGKRQQDSGQIDYNEYRRWLSTLHTVMLHDTIISQDEYDCLMMLAEHWLGVRQLF